MAVIKKRSIDISKINFEGILAGVLLGLMIKSLYDRLLIARKLNRLRKIILIYSTSIGLDKSYTYMKDMDYIKRYMAAEKEDEINEIVALNYSVDAMPMFTSDIFKSFSQDELRRIAFNGVNYITFLDIYYSIDFLKEYMPLELWEKYQKEVRLHMEEKNVKDSITKKPIQLDEVIIVGNKKTDPTHIEVFNVAKSKFLQPKNMADLFNNINGFSSIKRGSYAIDPSFRAAQYEQLNILYDGGTKVMHARPNRMDPITTHIISEEIAKIEVVKGSYTVRYGATFGAIINLVTKKPTYEDYGLHGKVSAGYESNGNSLVNSYRLQYIKEKFDLVTNAGYRNFGNYTDGIGTEIPSSFKSTDYGIKFGYNFSEKERFQVHWRQSFGKPLNKIKHNLLYFTNI